MSAPRLLVLVALLATLLVASADAQEPVRAGGLHVIGPEPTRQYYRTFPELFAITRAGEGFLAASWVSGNSDEEFLRLRALDDDGAPVAPEQSFGAYGLDDLRLAGDASGAWVVHSRWTADNVTAQRLTPTGARTGVSARVDTSAVQPDVLGQPDGGALVSLLTDPSEFGPAVAYVRRVGADGSVGPRVQVSGAGEPPVEAGNAVIYNRVALARAPSGAGAQAVWVEKTGADGKVSEIFTRRLGADGAPISPPVQLSSSERPLVTPSKLLGATRPSVAYEPSLGQYLVTWVSADAAVGGPQVLGRRLDASGAPLDAAPFTVSSERPVSVGDGVAYAPEVVSDASTGAWVVTRLPAWRPGIEYGYERVLARRLPWGDPTSAAPDAVVSDPYAGVGPPSIAAGPRGTVVGWYPVTQYMRGPVARRLGVGPDPGTATLAGAPAGDSPRREATLTLSSSRAGASFQCRVEPGDWQPCAAPWTVTGLADGVRRVAVRSVGPEGWVELGDGAQASWRVEAAPPESSFVTLPDPRSRYSFIRFTADERSTFECRWDQGAWRSCSESDGADMTLAVGPHSVEVRATDEVGRVEPVPARHEWTILPFPAAARGDAVPPETTILSGPPPRTRSTSATFTFESSIPGSTFICRTWSGITETCSSPYTLERVYDGYNELEVTAVAPDGTRDPSHAEWEWRVNAEPPETLLVATPNVRSETAYFSWRGYESDEVVRGDCRLDGGEWFSCKAPLQLAVPYGPHRFEVRSVDVDGDSDPTPAVHEWFADPVTPAVTITSAPSSDVNSTSAAVAFTLDRAGATAECRLDYGAWTSCTSPVTYSGLVEGYHRVQVRASNQGLDGLPDERRWRVDLTPPDTRIVGDPLADGSRTAKTTVTVSFESRDPGQSATERFDLERALPIRCRLDGGAWTSCWRSRTFTDLTQGHHVIEAYATDSGGNPDPTPARLRFVVWDWNAGPAPTPGPDPSPSPDPTTSPSPSPSPSPDADPSPSPDPTASPGPSPSPEPTASPLPGPPAADRSANPRGDGPATHAVPSAPVGMWAEQVAIAVRKTRAGRTVRVRLAAPAKGALEVRVLDRRGRTLARGSVRFGGQQRRTVTLKAVRRGARAQVSVRWTPAGARPQTARRSL